MAVQLSEEAGGKVLELNLSGKLTKEDYERFVPEVECLIRQHGKLRLLCNLEDFHGWTAGALWEDVKFDISHFNDVSRLALVGETHWQKGMALFCKPFTTAHVQYFDHTRQKEARNWIHEGLPAPTGRSVLESP